MRFYGEENFELEIIEEVIDIDDLDRREMHWIETLKPEYNMTPGGDGGDTSISLNYRNGIANRDFSGDRNPMFGKVGDLNPNKGSTRTETQKANLRRGVKLSWQNDLSRKETFRHNMIELNKTIGNYRRNAKPVCFEGIKYASLSEASRITLHSVKYIRANSEFL